MFRGKESSNRIGLSRLVKDLLNFGVLGSLRLGGWLGGAPYTCAHARACTHMHVHACTRTCMHTHARVVNMIISCKWLPPLGEYLGIPYDVIRVCMRACACMRMRVHMGEMHPLTTPHLHPPTPHPSGGPPESFKIQ